MQEASTASPGRPKRNRRQSRKIPDIPGESIRGFISLLLCSLFRLRPPGPLCTTKRKRAGIPIFRLSTHCPFLLSRNPILLIDVVQRRIDVIDDCGDAFLQIIFPERFKDMSVSTAGVLDDITVFKDLAQKL